MKTLRTLRESQTETAPRQDYFVEDETLDTTSDDHVGNALVALNHMSSVADDLYTVLGEDDTKFAPEDIDAILNCYDILSELHDKHNIELDMPSDNYDDEDLASDDIEEELSYQVEEIQLAEAGIAWKNTVKALSDVGMKLISDPKKYPWKPSFKVQHMFGIPMRAGKYADTFFAIAMDGDKPYAIADAEGVIKYADLDKALLDLNKRAAKGKLKEDIAESLSLNEDITPVGSMSDSDLTMWLKKHYTKRPQGMLAGQLKSAIAVAKERGLTVVKTLKDLYEEMESIAEGRDFGTFDDKHLKLWLKTNWTTSRVGDAFGKDLKAAAAEAKKRDLKWMDEETIEESGYEGVDSRHKMKMDAWDDITDFASKEHVAALKKIAYDTHGIGNIGKANEIKLNAIMKKYSNDPKQKKALITFKAFLESAPIEDETLEEAVDTIKVPISKWANSVVTTLNYDKVSKVMRVALTSGKTRTYNGVSADIWDNFKKSPNVRALYTSAEMTRALQSLLEEFSTISETPDSSPMAKLNKVRIQIKAYETKLDNPKLPSASKDAIKKILDRLEAQRKILLKQVGSKKNESLDEAPTKKQIMRAYRADKKSNLPKHSVQTMNLSMSGQMDPARLEVVGMDANAVLKLLDKIMPKHTGNAYDDQVGFKYGRDRKDAAAALVKYFKTVKEETAEIIDLGDINEAFDESKFKRLAATGLIDSADTQKVIKAMKQLEAGKTLSPAQKDLISSTFLSLIGLVTGDVSVFSKVASAAKKETV